MNSLHQQLATVLTEIEENDTNYSARYPLVLKAMYLASTIGYKTGVRIDYLMSDDDDEILWWVTWIELPTGEIAWHNPSLSKPYTGYTTDEKYERCHKYIGLHI